MSGGKPAVLLATAATAAAVALSTLAAQPCAAAKPVPLRKARTSAAPAKAAQRAAVATVPAPAAAPAAATPEQVVAAALVYRGSYDCELEQAIAVRAHAAYAGYVELAWRGRVYLMRPVLSSTGAVRLEDMAGEMLVVQIPVKSMLFDMRHGQRLADDCIGSDQAALNDARRESRALAARAAALPADAGPPAAAEPAAEPG